MFKLPEDDDGVVKCTPPPSPPRSTRPNARLSVCALAADQDPDCGMGSCPRLNSWQAVLAYKTRGLEDLLEDQVAVVEIPEESCLGGETLGHSAETAILTDQCGCNPALNEGYDSATHSCVVGGSTEDFEDFMCGIVSAAAPSPAAPRLNILLRRVPPPAGTPSNAPRRCSA